ncbi:hypothetical protein C5S29_10955 [ANME-1 cluster archaeon GoMg3.2]|nr:hypothetical protein [ANME-1 cluster archaeon GoMg3.2]
MCNLGKLDKGEQEAVVSLEKELGKTVLAFRCDLNAKPTALTEAELNQIQAVEDTHKLSLVAVE